MCRPGSRLIWGCAMHCERCPSICAWPLLLHHMEGYSLQEVADMLHISVAAARGRVYQARQKLRQQLDKEEQQP